MNAATQAYIRGHREQSAGEIAADLAVDPRLSVPIDTKALLAYAQHADLDVQLLATAQHPSCPAPLAVGILRFNAASAAGIPWNLDQPDIATKFQAWLAGMVQFHAMVPAAGFSQAQVDALIAQFGGLMLERLSETDVQTALDQLDRSDVFDALQQRAALASNTVMALITETRDGEGSLTTADLATTFAAAVEG
jgi:hypothetical protein